MASIKLLLWKHDKKKNETFPIAIRITKDRKTRYIFTGKYIKEKDWDPKNSKVKKSYPNSTYLNNFLISKLAEANKTILELEAEDKVVSSKNIKNEIVKPISNKSFNEVAKEFLDELEENKKLTRLSSNKPLVNHVIEFGKTNSLKFHDIDESFLRKFATFLKTKKGNSQRSVINAYILIRTLFNRAIKQGIIDRKYYPFGSGKITIRFPETEKIGLNEDEVRAIENLDKLTPNELHAKNIWLFSFYLAGIRVSDVLHIKWKDIYDQRLHYRMSKNGKLLSLNLPQKVFPILSFYNEYKRNNNDFVFPELRDIDMSDPKAILAKTKATNKKLNKYLLGIAKKAEIQKKITMHTARHTFAHIGGNKISIPTLQKLFRHTSITTTINYMNQFKHKDFDEALDSVVDF